MRPMHPVAPVALLAFLFPVIAWRGQYTASDDVDWSRVMPAVLALGLDPVFVDAQAMDGYSPAMVRAFIDSQLDRVRAAVYEVENCLFDLGATAEAVLSAKLGERSFDCVLIGAGLRAP